MPPAEGGFLFIVYYFEKVNKFRVIYLFDKIRRFFALSLFSDDDLKQFQNVKIIN